MKKLIPVAGDILYDNLGIEKNQLEQLYDEVRIFYFLNSRFIWLRLRFLLKPSRQILNGESRIQFSPEGKRENIVKNIQTNWQMLSWDQSLIKL